MKKTSILAGILTFGAATFAWAGDDTCCGSCSLETKKAAESNMKADVSSQNSRASLTTISSSCHVADNKAADKKSATKSSSAKSEARSAVRKAVRDSSQMTIVYSSKGGSVVLGNLEIRR